MSAPSQKSVQASKTTSAVPWDSICSVPEGSGGPSPECPKPPPLPLTSEDLQPEKDAKRSPWVRDGPWESPRHHGNKPIGQATECVTWTQGRWSSRQPHDPRHPPSQPPSPKPISAMCEVSGRS